MDPVIYSLYLYFLIVRNKQDNETDDAALKRIQSMKYILHIAQMPEYTERMKEMFAKINGANKFSMEDIDKCIR